MHHHPSLGCQTFIIVLFTGYMLLYLFTLRITALSMTYLMDSRHAAAAASGAIFAALSLAAGFSSHVDDLGDWVSWLSYVSPQYWMSHPILEGEFDPVKVLR